MVEAVDHKTLVDAWRRYQNGESGVFSRRLYTLSGQSIFDDVRKALKQDAEFAGTAKDFMVEFEQLLRDAAGGADPVRDTQTLLTSDRGKIYTMLAHAHGRLN